MFRNRPSRRGVAHRLAQSQHFCGSVFPHSQILHLSAFPDNSPEFPFLMSSEKGTQVVRPSRVVGSRGHRWLPNSCRDAEVLRSCCTKFRWFRRATLRTRHRAARGPDRSWRRATRTVFRGPNVEWVAWLLIQHSGIVVSVHPQGLCFVETVGW